MRFVSQKHKNPEEFNKCLDSIVKELREKKAGEPALNKEEVKRIKEFIEMNRSLFTGNESVKERLHFIETVKHLSDQLTDEDRGFFETEMKTSALFFKTLGKSKTSVAVIHYLKNIGAQTTLYEETLAAWINEQQVPIDETKLSEAEILKLAPYLTYLEIDGHTEEFIGNLLEKASNLNILIIKNNEMNGSALAKLKQPENLLKLVVKNCMYFNHPLPDNLSSLQKLEIGSSSFNHPLPDNLSNLQTLIFTFSNYKPFDYPSNSAFLILKFDKLLFWQEWKKLSTEAQRAYLFKYPFKYPEMKLFFDNLPLESKLSLLPVFSPDDIKKSILQIPQDARTKWLGETLEFHEFRGQTITVLKEIKKANLEVENPALDTLYPIFKGLLQKIPLKTLAALASEEPTIALSYMPFMDESQLSVVIPLLPPDHFVEFIMEQPVEKHIEFLPLATSDQIKSYLELDLMQLESVSKWEDHHKSNLEKGIEAFNKDPSPDHYTPLKSEWRIAYSSTNNALKQYKKIITSLERLLDLSFLDDERKNQIKTYIQSKKERMKAIEEELEQKRQLISVELAKKLPEVIEVSDDFIDEIMGTPMEDPYTDETGKKTLDKKTWEGYPTHPFTRAPIIYMSSNSTQQDKEDAIKKFKTEHPKAKPEDKDIEPAIVTPNKELKTEIEKFKKENPEAWEKAKQ